MRKPVEMNVTRHFVPDEEAMLNALRIVLNAKVVKKGDEQSA